MLPEHHHLSAVLGEDSKLLALVVRPAIADTDLHGLGASHQHRLLLCCDGVDQLQAIGVAGAHDAPSVGGVRLAAMLLAERRGPRPVDVNGDVAGRCANVPADAFRRRGMQLLDTQPWMLLPSVAYQWALVRRARQ